MLDILAGQVGSTLNIHSKSQDERAQLLSNFAGRPFKIYGHMMASVEGFIQGIKFHYHDERRERAFASIGAYAKGFSKHAPTPLDVWWGGVDCDYGSKEHHEIIANAICEKFWQNPDCMEALLATKGLALTHDIGEPESADTSLPAKVFCEILTSIRDEG